MTKTLSNSKQNTSSNLQIKERKTTFVPSVTPVPNSKTKEQRKRLRESNTRNPLLCCNKDHGLDVCNVLKHKPHNEKLLLSESKGLCYGCCYQVIWAKVYATTYMSEMLTKASNHPSSPRKEASNSRISRWRKPQTVTESCTVIRETCGCTGLVI